MKKTVKQPKRNVSKKRTNGSKWLEALAEYRLHRQWPHQLPKSFWATATCPPFEPPVGVFHYDVGPPLSKGMWDAATIFPMTRTAGYEEIDEAPGYRKIASETIMACLHDLDREREEMYARNEEYRQAKLEWEVTWIANKPAQKGPSR